MLISINSFFQFRGTLIQCACFHAAENAFFHITDTAGKRFPLNFISQVVLQGIRPGRNGRCSIITAVYHISIKIPDPVIKAHACRTACAIN